MTERVVSDDALVIVLLTSRLGLKNGAEQRAAPLTLTEWNQLAQTIARSALRRPGALLGRGADDLHEDLGMAIEDVQRLSGLLDRASLVALELERLGHHGLWVVTRADDDYPGKLKLRLGGAVPPVLFGAGPLDLLSTPGLAVVGSRDVDEAGGAYAEQAGRSCAAAALTVYSGGARGVDRIAMGAALEATGTAVGVMADSLERWSRQQESRQAILDGRLALVSPYQPQARFSVGNAMGRNKLIYCLADFGLVVSCSADGGGTRPGAVENLRRGWVPLFVRVDDTAPDGNRLLVADGAIAVDTLPAAGDLRSWLEERAATTAAHVDGPTQTALAL